MNNELFLLSPQNLIKKINDMGLNFRKNIAMQVSEIISNDYISIYDYINNYNDKVIVIPAMICDEFDIDILYNELLSLGVKKENIKYIPLEYFYTNKKIKEDSLIEYDDINYLNYLEICINDFCNMNCKGCSHFANLAPKEFEDFEQVKSDIIRLRQIFSHIDKIRIMGGEPLLNPDLAKYIVMIKQNYPYTDLRIVTNGILLKNISKDLLKCIRENEVMIDISVYPPLINKMDSIIKKLNEENIKVFIENIGKFKPILLNEKSLYPYKELRDCNCINLRNGYLASCPLVFTIQYINDNYNNKYNYTTNKINIYKKNVTAKDIKKQLKKPFELCNYCAHYRDDLNFFEWEQRVKNCKLEDWVSEE